MSPDPRTPPTASPAPASPSAPWEAIQIDMRDISSSCTTEPRRGGMRNSTRNDLGTTSAMHYLCFGCMLRISNAHGYDLGTTLVRPWNDLSKAWTQATPSIGTAPRWVKNPLLGPQPGTELSIGPDIRARARVRLNFTGSCGHCRTLACTPGTQRTPTE